MSSKKTHVHIDGAARGNPGPAAYAVVITPSEGEIVEESEQLGLATNNVAEYTALVRALERCNALGLDSLLIHSDSELMVKQMNGQYKVKNADLKTLYDRAQSLLIHFDEVTIKHVRREQNKRADELCNLALDGSPKPREDHRAPKAKSSAAANHSISKEPVDFEERCLEILLHAKQAWLRGEDQSVKAVWDELWKILQETGKIRA